MEYSYFQNIPDPQDPTKLIREEKKLVLETRVVSFEEDDEINNPTGDESAYFYGITIDGGREMITTFQPGAEGYQPMTKEQAENFLEGDVKQTLLNYGI